MKLWTLEEAVRIAIQRLHRPILRLHSFNWQPGDHQHICYAVRLLDEDDFAQVCPLKKQEKSIHPECEDACDHCPYFGCIEFVTDEISGQHMIDLWMGKP